MKVALVYNWPDTRTSELDLIGRMGWVLQQQGHQSVIIDPFGKLMCGDGRYQKPLAWLDSDEIDFVLNLHYTNPNFLAAFSYMVNWNPLGFVTHHPSTGAMNTLAEDVYLTSCQQSHDVLLSAGSDDVDNYSKDINQFNASYIHHEDLRLHTSCQTFSDLPEINLDEFKVFYIGVNWEKINKKGKTRHKGLLENLDDTGDVHFYGVEKIYGVKLWHGFANYKGELPFDDGASIVKTANSCGVSLILSSEAHRKSGLVSTRIFQACAAKTVIITDDNPFIEKHFGDSVLTFKHSSDSEETARRIIEKIEWVKQNKGLARQMADASHRKFVEHFSMESEMLRLLDGHAQVRADHDMLLMPLTESNQQVDVVYAQKTITESDLNTLIENLNRQRGVAPYAILIYAEADNIDVEAILNGKARFDYTLIVQPEMDDAARGDVILDALVAAGSADAFCLYVAGAWFSADHLGHMLRRMQDSGSAVVQSGYFIQNDLFSEDYNQRLAMLLVRPGFEPLTREAFLRLNVEAYPAHSFLFCRKLLDGQFEAYQPARMLGVGFYYYLIAMSVLVHSDYPEFVHKYSCSMKTKAKSLQLVDEGEKQEYASDIRRIMIVFRSSNLFSNFDLKDTERQNTMMDKLALYLVSRPVLLRLFRVVRAAGRRVMNRWL